MEPEREARLIEEAKTSPDACGELYDEFMPAVSGYVMRRVSSREAAEDITSATFEKALRSIDGLRKGTSFKGWLFRIAGNNVVDHYRSSGRKQAGSLEEAPEMANGRSGKAYDGVENRVAVMEMLEELSEPQRNVLALHYLEGLTVDEMAEALGSSPSACYMKVYRATRAFADLLERKGMTRIDDYAG